MVRAAANSGSRGDFKIEVRSIVLIYLRITNSTPTTPDEVNSHPENGSPQTRRFYHEEHEGHEVEKRLKRKREALFDFFTS